MKNELDSKRIRNIYIMLIAILCLTIISTTAIVSYIMVHWDERMNNNSNPNTEYDVSKFKKISYNEFMDTYKGDKKTLIYIGRATCIHCVNFVPVLKEAQDEYGYETYYLDISDITEQEYNNIRKLDSFLDENFGGTPMVIIVKNGKIIKNGTWIGEVSKNNFYKFLEKAGYKK